MCGDASIRPLLLGRTNFLQVVRFPPAAFHWLNLNQTVRPLGTEPASALSKPNTCSTLPMATTAVAGRTQTCFYPERNARGRRVRIRKPPGNRPLGTKCRPSEQGKQLPWMKLPKPAMNFSDARSLQNNRPSLCIARTFTVAGSRNCVRLCPVALSRAQSNCDGSKRQRAWWRCPYGEAQPDPLEVTVPRVTQWRLDGHPPPARPGKRSGPETGRPMRGPAN